ncbi:MAG: FAD-binding protein [Acidobacteriota bacterium]
MLKQSLLSVANAIYYLFTRRHILEGRFNPKTGRYRNWDGSHGQTPPSYVLPASDEELATVVRGARRVSCVGAGHSFNALHLGGEVVVSLDRYEGVVSHDLNAKTATFRAGTRMRDVNEFIEPLELALPLLPDHNAQSIAGVLATDVHATARVGRPGYISEYVTALKVMDGAGKVHTAEKGSPLFRATIGGMGCTGIILEATFQAEPIFRLNTRSFSCSFDELVGNLDTWYEEFDHFGAAYFPAADLSVVEAKKRSTEKISWLGSFREDFKHVNEAIALALLLPITIRCGRFGKKLGGGLLWAFTRLGDVLFTPLVLTSWQGFNRNVYHIHKEIEFACTPEQGRKVFARAKEVFDQDPNHSYYMIGVRRTRTNENTMVGPGAGAPDQELMWMAPHLVGNTPRPEDEAIWRQIIEDAEGRPHCGKNLVGITPEYIAAQLPEWNDFLRVVDEMDPQRKFTNDLVRATLENRKSEG